MIVKLLGSAAGGGVPQWNCRCANCELARHNMLVARTQSCVAFSADGVHWFLINASPDIRSQLELLPRPQGNEREEAFEAIFLSNADLDHTLGLLIVREGPAPTVYCSDDVWRTLFDSLSFDRILGAFKGGRGIDRRPVSSEFESLLLRGGDPSGLMVRTLMLGGSAPQYDSVKPTGGGHACAFAINDPSTDKTFLCALDVPKRDETLISELSQADLALIDGTFWSENEMIELGFSKRTSSQMGHWAICGENGSLQALQSARIPSGRIVYSHINNTNPILDLDSRERSTLERYGIAVGNDGMEWNL